METNISEALAHFTEAMESLRTALVIATAEAEYYKSQNRSLQRQLDEARYMLEHREDKDGKL